MSGKPAPKDAYDHGRKRSDLTSILDLKMWFLWSQIPLHARDRAARDALGARGCAGHHAKTPGSRSAENADSQANGRASVRNFKSMDGCHPLPHADARTSEYRDEPSRAGLQSQENDEDHGNRTADCSDANLNGRPVSLARTFLRYSPGNPRAKQS